MNEIQCIVALRLKVGGNGKQEEMAIQAIGRFNLQLFESTQTYVYIVGFVHFFDRSINS